MDPAAQAYLADKLAALRDPPIPFREQTPDDKRLAFATFRAVLDALAFVGMVDHNEIGEWTNRCLMALGEEPLEPIDPPPGVSVARITTFGAKPPPPRDTGPSPTAELVRVVPADTPAVPTAHGGKFQLLGIEIYNTHLAVGWRFAPLPDGASLLSDGLASLDADTEGMPEDQRQTMRQEFLRRRRDVARMMISISDDIGTEYHPMGGGASGRGNERVGRTQVNPAPPKDAKELRVRWEDVTQVVRLT